MIIDPLYYQDFESGEICEYTCDVTFFIEISSEQLGSSVQEVSGIIEVPEDNNEVKT